MLRQRDVAELSLLAELQRSQMRCRVDLLLYPQGLGVWHSALYQRVVLLERACGGQLVNRRHPAGTEILTPLGRQLCQQARDYLGIQPESGTP